MDKNAGIVGLGIMGHGMAVNILKAGIPLYVWNRTRSAADDLVAKGAVWCDSPAEVARQADVTFELTANDESSRAVWLSENGLLAGADTTKTLVASGTFSVRWIDELIGHCKTKRVTFLDIPVTGGRAGAEAGTLTLLCGGDAARIERLRPVFASFAKTVHHFGSAGSGMRYKLILNFMQALHIVGFGQAMRIAAAHGLDLPKVAEALTERPGGILTAIASKAYFTEPEPITFSIEWIVKDLTYAREFSSGLDITLLDELLRVYERAKDRGFGDKDWARITKLLEP